MVEIPERNSIKHFLKFRDLLARKAQLFFLSSSEIIEKFRVQISNVFVVSTNYIYRMNRK